jgi:hypothetical protein
MSNQEEANRPASNKGRNINYVPWNEYRKHEWAEEDWESYMHDLSITVSRACDKFFESRGMTKGQCDSDRRFNDYEK